ncbi:UNVERIFIED_CONTAM: hypothetical protein K2H54_061740 [Gekko kuhli]
MILLGSIERAQIVALLSEQLSFTRRLQYMREKAQAERRAAEKNPENEGQPPPDTGVRFQISTEESLFVPPRSEARKPLKPALKRTSSSLSESPTTGTVDPPGIALRSLFCGNSTTAESNEEEDSGQTEKRKSKRVRISVAVSVGRATSALLLSDNHGAGNSNLSLEA